MTSRRRPEAATKSMAKLLYIWELGGGLGHLSPMLPIVRRFLDEGQEVHLALRSMGKARLVFGELPVRYWQAPLQSSGSKPPYRPPATLTHVLGNAYFRDEDELTVRTEAWQSLIKAIEPDLTLLDHAPSALLALESFSIPRVVMGIGFAVPPRCDPFPLWRPELKLGEARLRQDDEMLLQRLNRWRGQNDLPPDELLADLYAKVDQQLLMTFPELDPFGPRRATYQGVWPGLAGKPTHWANTSGGLNETKRVFIYVKPHKEIESLLHALRDSGANVLLFIPGIDPRLVKSFEGPRMVFSSEPVDLTQAAEECDLAVLNATLLSVATFLLAGKPLLLPIFLEQRLTAERVAAMGAGSVLPADRMDQCGEALRFLLRDDRPRRAAQEFQTRYQQFNFAKRAAQVATYLLELRVFARISG